MVGSLAKLGLRVFNRVDPFQSSSHADAGAGRGGSACHGSCRHQPCFGDVDHSSDRSDIFTRSSRFGCTDDRSRDARRWMFGMARPLAGLSFRNGRRLHKLYAWPFECRAIRPRFRRPILGFITSSGSSRARPASKQWIDQPAHCSFSRKLRPVPTRYDPSKRRPCRPLHQRAGAMLRNGAATVFPVYHSHSLTPDRPFYIGALGSPAATLYCRDARPDTRRSHAIWSTDISRIFAMGRRGTGGLEQVARVMMCNG